MGNTVGGDDKPVLQCRTDSRMIPYRVWMADSADRREKNTAGRREVFIIINTYRCLCVNLYGFT